MEPEDGGSGAAPYPDYEISLTWKDMRGRIEWTGRGSFTLSTKGVWDRVTFHDPEGRAWQACASVLPPPSPGGVAELFAATGDVLASGGDLDQPISCDARRVPVLVRLLRQGGPSSEAPPSSEGPVTVTFSNPERQWEVKLYEKGFLFDGTFYRFEGMERAFVLTMTGSALSDFGRPSPAVTATVRYGPFGPVDLPAEPASAVLIQVLALGPGRLVTPASGGWPLEIQFGGGAGVSKIVAWPEGLLVDGQPWGTARSGWPLAASLQSSFEAGLRFTDAFKAAGSVTLTPRDAPSLATELESGQRAALGSAMDGLTLKDPDSGYGGAPYPDYEVGLSWGGGRGRIDWTGREYFTLWVEGVLRSLTFYDAEGRAWQSCVSILASPPLEKLGGVAALFAATGDVLASGGDLGRPFSCGGWKVPILVRLLREGKPSLEAPPGDETPVTVTFSNPERQWEVELYENGFFFDGTYYRLDGVERTFLTTMNAG